MCPLCPVDDEDATLDFEPMMGNRPERQIELRSPSQAAKLIRPGGAS
jgi:hypothetical protein